MLSRVDILSEFLQLPRYSEAAGANSCGVGTEKMNIGCNSIRKLSWLTVSVPGTLVVIFRILKKGKRRSSIFSILAFIFNDNFNEDQ